MCTLCDHQMVTQCILQRKNKAFHSVRQVWRVIPAECRQGLFITFVSSTLANNHTQTFERGSAESASSPDKWPGEVRRGDSRKEKHSCPHQHDNHHTQALNSHDEDQSLNVLVNKNLNDKKCGVIYGFKQPLIFFSPFFSALSFFTAVVYHQPRFKEWVLLSYLAIWNMTAAAAPCASQRNEYVDFHCAIKRMGSGRAVKQDRRQSNKWLWERMWTTSLGGGGAVFY